MRELAVWVSQSYPEVEDLFVVDPRLAMAAHQPEALRALASLTVCSLDAMETHRLLHANDSPAEDFGILMAFFQSQLLPLDAAAERWLPSARYQVVCLGRSIVNSHGNVQAFMPEVRNAKGHKVELLRDRSSRHAAEILNILGHGGSSGMAGRRAYGSNPRAEMLRMLHEISLEDLHQEWVHINREVGNLGDDMAREVTLWFSLFVDGGDNDWGQLERYAALVREALTLAPIRPARFMAAQLLGFDKKYGDNTFVLKASAAAHAAREAGQSETVYAVLLLLHKIQLVAAMHHVDSAAVLLQAPILCELLRLTITDPQAEAESPCVLAAVRLLATVHHAKRWEAVAELLQAQSSLLQPIFHWLSGLRSCHLDLGPPGAQRVVEWGQEADGDRIQKKTEALLVREALVDVLQSLADLFFARRYLHHLLAVGLDPVSMCAVSSVAKLVLVCPWGHESLRYYVLQLVERLLACCHGRRNELVSLLAEDDALFDTVRDSVHVPVTERGISLGIRAVDTLRAVLKARQTLVRIRLEDADESEAAAVDPMPGGDGEDEAVDGQPEEVKDGASSDEEEVRQESNASANDADGALGSDPTPPASDVDAHDLLLGGPELMARLEHRLIQAYAGQRALRNFDPELDAIAQAADAELLAVTDLQERVATLTKVVEEGEAAAMEAEASNIQLCQEVRDLKARLAQMQQAQRAAALEAIRANEVAWHKESAEAVDSHDGQEETSRSTASMSASLSRMALDLKLEGKAADVRARVLNAVELHRMFKADRTPLTQEARALEVIDTMRVINELEYACEGGADRLTLVDLLGPAQNASSLHFLQEVLQNFGDCR